MANIRNLKKNLNYLTMELMAECLTYKHFHPEMNTETFEKAVSNVITNHNDLIHRCSKFDKKAGAKEVRSHFRAIRADFEKSIEALDSVSK